MKVERVAGKKRVQMIDRSIQQKMSQIEDSLNKGFGVYWVLCCAGERLNTKDNFSGDS